MSPPRHAAGPGCRAMRMADGRDRDATPMSLCRCWLCVATQTTTTTTTSSTTTTRTAPHHTQRHAACSCLALAPRASRLAPRTSNRQRRGESSVCFLLLLLLLFLLCVR